MGFFHQAFPQKKSAEPHARRINFFQELFFIKLFFELFLLLGYACGIARKIMQTVDGSSGFLFFLSFFFYILNFVEISIDVALYFRNKKLDELAEKAAN